MQESSVSIDMKEERKDIPDKSVSVSCHCIDLFSGNKFQVWISCSRHRQF